MSAYLQETHVLVRAHPEDTTSGILTSLQIVPPTPFASDDI